MLRMPTSDKSLAIPKSTNARSTVVAVAEDQRHCHSTPVHHQSEICTLFPLLDRLLRDSDLLPRPEVLVDPSEIRRVDPSTNLRTLTHHSLPAGVWSLEFGFGEGSTIDSSDPPLPVGVWSLDLGKDLRLLCCVAKRVWCCCAALSVIPIPQDENDGIDGMETVIATVSGYHGAERFQLIKLIALTGANYVGSFSKSTTHMVCWELRGKKYELAKSLGTKVVSHQWFEDCLKEKKRLPEGPYIMICGKQVGHLSLKIPDRSSHGKRKCELVIKKRKMLHDRSNIYCNYGDLDVGCSTYDDINRIGLCHTYIPESSLSSMISAKGKNKNINTYSDVQITDVDSLRRGLGQQPESSSSSMIFAKGRSKKNNTYNCVETSIDVHPVRRRRRLVKTNAYPDCIDCIDLECDETKEPCAPEQSIIQDSAGIVNTRTVAECCNLQENVTREFVDINLSSSTSPGQNMAHMNCLKESSTRISATGNTREFEIDLSSIHSDHLTTSELGQLAADGSSSLNENCYSVASNDKERKGNDELDEFSILTDLSCVICLTSFSSTRGVLPCGHRFCYSCIESWADHMVSSEKTPTCPLCKVSFTSVTKVEGAVSSDQKIFSQTVPASTSNTDVFVFPNGEDRGIHAWTALNGGESVCSECRNREPEDLLLSCHVCSRQWVHSCCLDPPLVPWTCIHCRDSRMLYLLSR